MYVKIDLAAGTADLAEPANFGQFHIIVPGGGAAESVRVLGTDGAPADDGHVWVSIAAVRRWAGPTADADWEAGFEKMLEYADSKGWVDDDRTHLRAHIEAEGT